MPDRNASEKIELLDQYLHALLKRFYLRPSLDGRTPDVSGSQFFALSLVGRQRRCTMTELARECGLALSSITAVIDRLVTGGYVKRGREEEGDRRKVFVELNRKGERAYQDLLEGEMEMIIAMMESLNPREQDTLLRVMGKATSSLRK